MNKKLVGIFVCALLFLTALPVTGTMNENKSRPLEQSEQEIDNPRFNIIFISGFGFRVIFQNLENETVTIDTITILNVTIGHIEWQNPMETIYNVQYTLESYESKTLKTLFPLRCLGIGRITAEVYDDDSGEFICGKMVYCIMGMFFQLMLPWTESWY